MRRFFYWSVPLAAAIVSALVFGAGFYSFLRGDTGEPVTLLSQGAAKAPTPRGRLAPIVLGDSLARGAGDETGLGIGGRLDGELRRRNIPAIRTVNVAVSGARTADLLRLLESRNVQTLVSQANVVIVSIGGNDLWGGSDWRTSRPPDPDAIMNGVLERIESAMGVIRRANPRAKIFLIGLYNPFGTTPTGAELSPFVARWNARLMERFAGDPAVVIVQTADLFAGHNRLALDQFHPGGEGYGLIARRIADAL